MDANVAGDDRILDSIRGCLVGGAAGDALGYAIEFSGEGQIFSSYGRCGITAYELDAYSGKALVSDDTQMTLFTATGLLTARTRAAIEPDAPMPRHCVASAYQDWLRTQELSWREAQARLAAREDVPTSWLAYVPGLYDLRAPGNTCLSALRTRRAESRHPADYRAAALNNSKGCGGVMRAAPVGLAWPDGDLDRVNREAAQIAAITHGHPLGYLPAAVLAHIVNQLTFVDEQPALEKVVREASDALVRLFADDAHARELASLVEYAVDLSHNGDSDLDNIHRLGEGWVGDEALAIAIYCALRHQTDFSAGIIAAVNHRGDSDSTGAVAGNILGALLGYGAIGDAWTRDLELHDVIVELADDLWRAGRMSPDDFRDDPAWTQKYVACRRR